MLPLAETRVVFRRANLLRTLLSAIVCAICGCAPANRYVYEVQQDWLTSSNAEASAVDTAADDLNNAYSARTYVSGRLQSSQLGELSGLAASTRHPEVFWGINDSGNDPVLFAIRRNGESLRDVPLAAVNRDWEDLASFEDNNQHWLLIAETGDNLRKSREAALYIFAEPDLAAAGRPLVAERTIRFRYPDQAQNVESVTVSPRERRIYLIAKRASGAGIYTLPLDAETGEEVLLATRVGELRPLDWNDKDLWWEKALAGRIMLAPTAVDIAADDHRAVVANYRHVYLFERKPGQSWAQAFGNRPAIIASHRLAQSESVAFSADGRTVLVSSEGYHAPLLLIVPQFAIAGAASD